MEVLLGRSRREVGLLVGCNMYIQLLANQCVAFCIRLLVHISN